jgi:hypothetical protein
MSAKTFTKYNNRDVETKATRNARLKAILDDQRDLTYEIMTGNGMKVSARSPLTNAPIEYRGSADPISLHLDLVTSGWSALDKLASFRHGTRMLYEHKPTGARMIIVGGAINDFVHRYTDGERIFLVASF